MLGSKDSFVPDVYIRTGEKATMVNETTGKVHRHGPTGMHIYIPKILATDSQNPIGVGMDVKITVDGEKMKITPVSDEGSDNAGECTPIK